MTCFEGEAFFEMVFVLVLLGDLGRAVDGLISWEISEGSFSEAPCILPFYFYFYL